MYQKDGEKYFAADATDAADALADLADLADLDADRVRGRAILVP